MREYALNQAISRGEYGVVSFARRLARNWKAKRRIVALGDFDDYMLQDIGITRRSAMGCRPAADSQCRRCPGRARLPPASRSRTLMINDLRGDEPRQKIRITNDEVIADDT